MQSDEHGHDCISVGVLSPVIESWKRHSVYLSTCPSSNPRNTVSERLSGLGTGKQRSPELVVGPLRLPVGDWKPLLLGRH
jgi:hypothetical protein